MLTMDVNRTYLVLNSCFQFPARRALQGDSVNAIILFCEAFSQKLLCVQSVCTRTTAVRTGHVWFHIDMNTQDGGTNRYQVPGLLAIFRRKNRSREPLYTEFTVLLTASSRKKASLRRYLDVPQYCHADWSGGRLSTSLIVGYCMVRRFSVLVHVW